jgi:hypothetical protein
VIYSFSFYIYLTRAVYITDGDDAEGNDGGDEAGDASGDGGGECEEEFINIVPGIGLISNAVAVRLSSDPSKRKSFIRQVSDASDNFKDKVYRRNQGIHYVAKTYAYYFTWLPYDLHSYCFMLGLDHRKRPCKTTVAAATAFVAKYGTQQVVANTVGFVPGFKECINSTFNRYDQVKMIIEHLEKWDVLEDYCPKSKEEWEIFTKVHADMAAVKTTAYEGSAPWTDEQAEVFLQRLRLLHVKDCLSPMKLCDMLGTGVPKTIPSLADFECGNIDHCPQMYDMWRRGPFGPMLKAFYGGSKDVCQKAITALREANIPFDLAYNLLKRRSDFKRKWGDYIRSIFLAARQQYANRPEPFDWKAHQEIVDKRKAIEEFIAKRREERRLKRLEAGKKGGDAEDDAEDDKEDENCDNGDCQVDGPVLDDKQPEASPEPQDPVGPPSQD